MRELHFDVIGQLLRRFNLIIVSKEQNKENNKNKKVIGGITM